MFSAHRFSSSNVFEERNKNKQGNKRSTEGGIIEIKIRTTKRTTTTTTMMSCYFNIIIRARTLVAIIAFSRPH